MKRNCLSRGSWVREVGAALLKLFLNFNSIQNIIKGVIFFFLLLFLRVPYCSEASPGSVMTFESGPSV